MHESPSSRVSPPRGADPGDGMKIVIFGLTITSAWGNGHATTFRSLVKALDRRGHRVVFIEKDVEWYRSNRDLPKPGFCTVDIYDDWEVRKASFVEQCSD